MSRCLEAAARRRELHTVFQNPSGSLSPHQTVEDRLLVALDRAENPLPGCPSKLSGQRVASYEASAARR